MKIQNQPSLPPTRNFSQYSKADQEILNDLYEKGDLRENADVGKLLAEYKTSLNGSPRVESFTGYHSYDEMTVALQDLAARFPGKAEVVSLGQSAEGREIYALRVGTPDEANPKPGVVITGCHHAREWMTVEVPLHTATNMLENYETDPASKERVDKTVTWFVPMVNPDGYEYSRTKNGWWRKTRRPITETGCPNMKGNMGVDPNRNYWDGKPEHFELYRPAGDTQCSTADDFGDGKTSDNPRADTYRGPSGGSEPEVQAMLNLELNPANNIKGVVDYHSYGDMILYPYGSKELSADRLEIYRDIGGKMNQVLGNRFDLKPSSDLYPTSGGSNDIHEANGILGLTLEIGRSFQPPPSEIPKITAYITPANLVFIDEIKARFRNGVNSRWFLLLGLTAVMLQLCWKILTPFLSILLWASVLVLVFYPIYRRILLKLNGRSTAASMLTTFLVLATIILPMVAVTGMVVAELENTAREIQAEIPRHLERLPEFLEIVYRYTGMTQEELKRAVQTGARTSSQTLLGGMLSVVGGVVGFLINLGFVSFTMFYLFIDGDKAVQTLRDWLPLERSQSHALLVRAGEIISASVYGVVVLAVIQGSLGGLMFWWLGLPSPLLWGVVMILFATIPMLGTFVIWVPAAIYLALNGAMIKAVILTLWGSVVIGMSDNLLRPVLVGKKAKMHDLMIFFAVLGGLRAFGVLGVLMGPVVLAVSLTLLEAFRRADPMRTTEPSVELDLEIIAPLVEPMTVSSPTPPAEPTSEEPPPPSP